MHRQITALKMLFFQRKALNIPFLKTESEKPVELGFYLHLQVLLPYEKNHYH